MGQTADYAIPYPGVSDAPDGPNGFQASAERTAAVIKGIDTRLGSAETAQPKYSLGKIAGKTTPATSTGLAASSVMLDLVPVTLKAGRQYRIEYKTDIRTPDASASYVCQIVKSVTGDAGTTGTVLESGNLNASPQINSWSAIRWDTEYTPVADETVNIKAVIARLTGTAAYDVAVRRLAIVDEGKP